jgi:hypothetical protein
MVLEQASLLDVDAVYGIKTGNYHKMCEIEYGVNEHWNIS